MEQKNNNNSVGEKLGTGLGTALGVAITVFVIALIGVAGFKLLMWLWTL